MSYEGSEEYLCAEGHYTCRDCHEERVRECPHCTAPIAFCRAIDETNGEDDELPCTKPGPKTLVGFDDDWRIDHYGNRYAVKILRYVPGEHWHQVIVSPVHPA